ncbi:MAG: D-sedoheptulose 7-phosphate isomerase [Candidatus Omnitrophica bacterium]|nr:D-sedoheptulose 7-phosphate isomerase [Candidatus Omnitrophota bacterium]
MSNKIENIFKETAKVITGSLTDGRAEVLGKMASRVVDSLKKGGKVILCGNGGSASQAQHIAAEFVGRFKKERPPYAAIALTDNSSLMTCIPNDYSFDAVFARQLEGLGRKGDVLIAISTSGSSKNVIEAMKKAKSMGIIVISFTGKGGGKMSPLADYDFCVPSDNTPRVQEVHLLALHALCELAEEDLA